MATNSNTNVSGHPSSQKPVQPVEAAQPTVRVMRLYKPGMHIVPPTPLLPLDIDDDSNSANNSNNNNNNSSATKTDYNFLGTTGDFILSNFLLLPDSFGDIYTGETFSAYIAVVNGYPETSFFMVTLAIRLQTSSKVFDLADTKLISTDKLLQNERNGKDINNSVAKTSTNTTVATTTNNNSKTLGFNDTLDVLVQHTLTELGTHTLRVTVSYFLPQSNEPKSLRKFYRFNVLQPLSIASSFVMMQNKPMVQCQVINATKSPIYIKETNFIPRVTNSSFVKVPADNTADSSLLILNPDESYAFSFIFTSYDGSVETALGHPTVTWCTSMGEYSVFHGDDTVLKTNSNDGRNSKKDGLTIECMKYPTSVLVGDEFEVIIRISNHTTLTASVRLHCNIPSIDMENSSNETNSNEDYGLCVLGVTHTNIGAVDPGEFEDVTLRVYAMNPGLQSLVGLSAIDLSLRREYKANSLCKVLVRNESE